MSSVREAVASDSGKSADSTQTPLQNKEASTMTTRAAHTPPSQRKVTVLLSPFDWGGTGSACSAAAHGTTPRSAESRHVLYDMTPSAVAESRNRKPECSYAVLIGIAMRAAQAANYGQRLPVIEIYRFIEKEFPYFRNCKSSGWKNCVRHCLSFGQFFRKVERSVTESTAIKGNYWEIIPEKRPLLNRDIETFVLDEYRTYIQKQKNNGNAFTPTQQSQDNTTEITSHIHPLSSSLPQQSTAYVLAQLHAQSTANTSISSTEHVESPLPTLREEGVFNESHNANLSLLSTTPYTQTSSLDTTHRQVNSSAASSSRSPTPHCGPARNHTAYFDEENPLPPSSVALQSTEVYHCKTPQDVIDQRNKRHTSTLLSLPTLSHPNSSQHLQNRDSYMEGGIIPSVTNASQGNGADCSSSEMYVFPGGKISPSNASESQQILNGIPTHYNENNEAENPLINPTHPVVNTGTLASINGGIDTPKTHYFPVTPHTVTLVTALTHSTGNTCHPTVSGHSGTRMSHTIFCPPHTVHRCPIDKSVVPNIRHYFHSSSKQKRPRFREEHIPPALRPVLTHMHDPSHFLPSSKFYDAPPYVHRADRVRTVDGTIDAHSVRNTENDVIGKQTRNGVKKHPKCRYFSEEVLTDSNSSPQMLRHSPLLSQIHLAQPHTQTRANLNHSNNNTANITSSKKDNLRLIRSSSNTLPPSSPSRGVSDHTPSTSVMDEEASLFEVSTDCMKLSIAREEEVVSSLFDDVASYFDPSTEIENVL